MPKPIEAQLSELSQAWADQAEKERLAAEARKTAKALEERVLASACPEQVRQSKFIPLTKTTGLIVQRLVMSPPLTPGRLPYWTAHGAKVRFRVGNKESIGPAKVEQPYYEALPEEIRALTRETMIEASKEQKLTGLDAPLKITDRQASMLSLLATNNERLRFSVQPVEGGQRLPSAIWDSVTSTQSIWTAMVKRGVLVIEKGSLSDRWSHWGVNPGPRFAEAVDLVGKSLASQHPGSPASEEFLRHFKVAQPRRPRP